MENKLVRLNRYLAQCGIASRRECDTIIAKGLVEINGEKVIEMGVKVDPESDTVSYKGDDVKQIKKMEYVAYHKEVGTLVTRYDPEGRKTVYDALFANGKDATLLNYIGRLDMFSEGLLLMSNDGDLIHALTHPKFHIKKVYLVRVDKKVSESDMQKMVNDGVVDNDQLLKFGAIRPKIVADDGFWYEVDLYEGKNRQVRRVFEGFEYTILRLIRTQYSAVKLRDLKRGEYRVLGDREIKNLKGKGYSK